MNATPQRLVVIEADAAGLTHGAWFDLAAREAVAAALAGTNAILIDVDQPKLDQVDPGFPAGKLAATGRPSLPVIKRTVYDRLATLAVPPPAVQSPPDAPEAGKAAAYAGVIVGSVVLASETKGEGWWEAVVVRLEQNGGTLRLKWKEFPEMEEFTKPLNRVAIPPAGGQR